MTEQQRQRKLEMIRKRLEKYKDRPLMIFYGLPIDTLPYDVLVLLVSHMSETDPFDLHVDVPPETTTR